MNKPYVNRIANEVFWNAAFEAVDSLISSSPAHANCFALGVRIINFMNILVKKKTSLLNFAAFTHVGFSHYNDGV
jgi:hypothetical protein